MTQSQLECAVAGATGESVTTVHRHGFSLLASRPADLEPEDLRLVLDCPFCGVPVAYPGTTRDGSLALAECDSCDVYFDFAVKEVYAVGAADRCETMSGAA